MPPYTLLVIEDDAEITRAVGAALRDQGPLLVEAAGGKAGIEAVNRSRPDIIVLDLGLPDMDGLDVCRRMRSITNAPIVVLTARNNESDVVALLNAGADDYITKPFSTQALAARVAAQLRRAREMRNAPLQVSSGGVSIDIGLRQVNRGSASIRLTPIEWEILSLLASDPGRVFTHQQIFDAVWKRSYGDARLYLRVHVTNLRRKIELEPADPVIIITEPGIGYRFNP